MFTHNTTSTSRYQSELFTLILQGFNQNELKTLCFNLTINDEDLPAQTREDLAREIIRYMYRHGRLKELLEYCRKKRPLLSWPEITILGTPEQDHIINQHLLPDEQGVFLGRKDELAWLHAQFHNPAKRLIGIIGQGGYGKTSLLAHFLRAIKENPHALGKGKAVRGITYYQYEPKQAGPNLIQVAMDVGRILGEPFRSDLLPALNEEPQKLSQTLLTTIHEALAGKNEFILIAMDNLEWGLNEKGELRNWGLQKWIEQCLKTSAQVKFFCTTQRYWRLADDLLHYHDWRNLDTGLSRTDSIKYLRTSDPDGRHKLRNEKKGVLVQAYQKVGGIPFGLVKIVALCRQPGSLSELLNDIKFSDQVIHELAERCYSHLTVAEREGMNVLALFPLGVSIKLLGYLLQREQTEISTTLERLFQGHAVNHQLGIWSLHDIDSQIVRANMKKEESAGLHIRAADYYKQLQSSSVHPTTPADLEALLQEHYHAVEGGLLSRAASIFFDNALADLLEDRMLNRLVERTSHMFAQVPRNMAYSDYLVANGFTRITNLDVPFSERARLFRLLGKCCRYVGNFVEAIEALKQGLALLEKQDEPQELLQLCREASLVLIWQGKSGEALTWIERGLEAAALLADDKAQLSKAELHMSAGLAHRNQGSFQESLAHYKKAQELYQNLKNESRSYAAYDNQGMVQSRLGHYTEAAEIHQKMLTHFESQQRWREAGGASLNLGAALHFQSKYKQAQHYYETSLTYLKKTALSSEQMIAHYHLGEVLVDMENGKAALLELNKALKISEEIGELQERAFILFQLGRAHNAIGNKGEASKYLSEAVAVAKESDTEIIDDIQELLDIIHNL